uniref:Uncharacterized protein n=1 Tax=Pipistrellus kuhlii TaxID=59472 RepID=A0A7J7Y999_PIPKU|nr:hypothetical protein mPipKuh1_010336 [Pipistrellus kuhlii]
MPGRSSRISQARLPTSGAGPWGIEPAFHVESVTVIKHILVVTPREPEEANTRLPATVGQAWVEIWVEIRGGPGCGEGVNVKSKLRRPLGRAGLGREAIVPSAHSQRERRENGRKVCPRPLPPVTFRQVGQASNPAICLLPSGFFNFFFVVLYLILLFFLCLSVCLTHTPIYAHPTNPHLYI